MENLPSFENFGGPSECFEAYSLGSPSSSVQQPHPSLWLNAGACLPQAGRAKCSAALQGGIFVWNAAHPEPGGWAAELFSFSS